MRLLLAALTFLVSIVSAGALIPRGSAPSTTEEVQILGSRIGVGLSDTGTAGGSNILLSTQAFTGPDWLPALGAAADNQTTAPDSTTTAASFTETAATGFHTILQSVAKAAAPQTYTISFSAKSALRSRVIVAAQDQAGANGAYAVFDLAGVQVGVAGSTFGTGWSIATVAIPTSQANGFVLCAITITTDSSASMNVVMDGDANSGTQAANDNYAGNNSGPAFYVWGANGNVGSSIVAYGNVTNAGAAATALADNDTTTFWGTRTGNSWVGLDAGSAVTLTRYRFAPRPGNLVNSYALGLDYETLMQGAMVQTSSDCTFATGVSTADTIPATPYYPRFWLNERPLPVSARCVRLLPSSVAFGSVAELQFFGRAVPGAIAAAPVAPVINPLGGRFPAGSTTVTLSSLSANASIYYTTDGSVPSNSHGTLYSGPFTLTVGGAVTFKAVAYEPALSTPLSAVQAATFNPTGIVPTADWYDDHGNLIEAHFGGIFWDAGTSKYYWVGGLLNKASPKGLGGFNINFPRQDVGVLMYSSTDLLMWHYEGNILPNAPGTSVAGQPWLYTERMHVIHNASTGKYVIWAHVIDTGYTNSLAAVATAPSITGPWAWNGAPFDPDGEGFKDDSLYQEGTDAYVVYTIGTQNGIRISKLSTDYLTSSGVGVDLAATAREAPVLLKNSSNYFLVTSESNLLNSAIEVDPRYITSAAANPLSGWGSLPGAGLFAADPIGTAYNGQPSFALTIQGSGVTFIGSDFWTQPVVYNSRQSWAPLTFVGATVQAQTPAGWNP